MKDGVLTMNSYKQLTFIKAVIDEMLRLYPTAYVIGRESKEDDVVKNIEIPKM